MKWNRMLILIFAVILASATPSFGFAPAIREIQQPTFSLPAFTLPGGVVAVTLEISGAGRATRATLTPVAGGQKEIDIALDANLRSGKNPIDLVTPKNIAAGLYDLCVEMTYSGFPTRDCQRHSVAVLKSFEPPFTFVHITDYHMGDPRAGKQFPGVDMEKVRTGLLEAANEANPAFVILTGDITSYPESYAADYPAVVEELVSRLKAPLLTLPGNHDFYACISKKGKLETDGTTYWPYFFGPTHRVLDFGRFRFILFNTYTWDSSIRNQNREYSIQRGTAHTYNGTLTADEFNWLQNALATSGNRTPILASHHGPKEFETNPVHWCKTCVTSAQFEALIAKYKVPYYFYGHIHHDEEYQKNGTQFFATTSAGSDVGEKEMWSIRVVHVMKDGTMKTELVSPFKTPPMDQQD